MSDKKVLEVYGYEELVYMKRTEVNERRFMSGPRVCTPWLDAKGGTNMCAFISTLSRTRVLTYIYIYIYVYTGQSGRIGFSVL